MPLPPQRGQGSVVQGLVGGANEAEESIKVDKQCSFTHFDALPCRVIRVKSESFLKPRRVGFPCQGCLHRVGTTADLA
jgi:hypothetical protein